MTKIIRRPMPAAHRRQPAPVYIGKPCRRCSANVKRVSNRTCAICTGRTVEIEIVSHSVRSHTRREVV